MRNGTTGDAWLTDFPLLSPEQRREVASVFRRGLVESPLPTAFADLDSARILGCNAEFAAMLGIDETDLNDRSIGDFTHPDDRPKTRAIVERLRSRTTTRERYEARLVRPDGRIVWTRRHIILVDGPHRDDKTYIVGVLEDITAQRQSQHLAAALVDIGSGVAAGASLMETAERLGRLAQARWSEVGVTLNVLDRERNVLVPMCPNAVANGWADDVPEIPVGPTGGTSGTAAWRDEPTTSAGIVKAQSSDELSAVCDAQGIVSSWAVPLHDAEGQVVGTLGLFHPFALEPTEADWRAVESVAGVAAIAVVAHNRRTTASQERQRVRTDPRTGLLNDVGLLEQVEALLAQHKAISLAVATLRGPGRLASEDAVAKLALRTLATRAASLGQVAHVAATGVTSLVFVARAEWGDREARLLHRVLTRPLEIGTSVIRPEVAVGVCVAASDQTPCAVELLTQATLAVPARGGANVVEPEVSQDRRDYDLAADLARGMRKGEFVVHYQPQFDLKTGLPAGAEALARWNHPARGLLLPGEFLPVVDFTGASTELAFLVVRATVAEKARREQVGLHGRVAVNLSVEDLLNESFLHILRDPDEQLWKCVSLELTETQMARAEAVTALEELAALGYEIALDDFGTGYSALSAIHTLPISIVKIDQSFVARLPHDASAEALIAAITAMCQQLAITVVAEGVETKAQERAVRDLGCDVGQGYLFGRPQALDDYGPDAFQPRGVPKKSRRTAAEAPIGTAAMERLFDMHKAGASPATIAAALNRSGYRAAGGTRWHARSVVKALGDMVV